MQDPDAIVTEALDAFARIDDADQLEKAKARYLGKSGALSQLLKGVSKLPVAERPAFGSRVNSAKERLEAALADRREHIRLRQQESRLAQDALDVTLPGRGLALGGLHPVTRTLERIEQLFRSMGFEVADGPEIETDYYNFTALNQPENHPARSMHDTFYLADGRHLLRTHMSPIQIRYLETHRPPVRVIAPWRVYRRDYDATHSPMFHQIEGFVVDERTSFAELKGTLTEFATPTASGRGVLRRPRRPSSGAAAHHGRRAATMVGCRSATPVTRRPLPPTGPVPAAGPRGTGTAAGGCTTVPRGRPPPRT